MAVPPLSELISPERCAFVTQELQGGVVGPSAALATLAEAAADEALPNIVRLLAGARAARVPVIHCLVEKPNGDRASGANCRLYQAGKKFPMDLSPGSDGSRLLPQFGPEPHDITLTRAGGLSPMSSTDLDLTLRNLGVTTIVGVGVSVNIAITNFVMDAVNLGYWFVLPRDAVAGVPREYAESVIDNTLSLLAHVVTTDRVLEAWPS